MSKSIKKMLISSHPQQIKNVMKGKINPVMQNNILDSYTKEGKTRKRRSADASP